MSFSVSWFYGQLRYSGIFFGRRCIRLTNRTPLISFTFDDFPRSALYTGGDILQEYAVRATYYTALGLMNTDGPVGQMFSEQDLREVVARGDELGCHTFDHCNAWSTHPERFEDSIVRNGKALNQRLPGVSFTTFSYPLGVPRPQTKRRTEKYFLGCRGCTQKINAGIADLNFLRAFFLEQSPGDAAVKAIIDRNCRAGGWLIFATHDVSDNPSRFGCTRRLFKQIVHYAVASGATILPVAAALKKLSSQHAEQAVTTRNQAIRLAARFDKEKAPEQSNL
jgi:peptidoglycan/xylan/chitin deacetylase (PgdA/CDA1 family)